MFNYFKILAVSIMFLISAVNVNAQEMIQIKGSDTMVNLAQAWAEGFMNKYPQSFVAVTGGGSGTGIASLLNKTCDIAECSRKMKQKEIDLARQKGIEPVEFTVGLDGLAVVVHPSNSVDKLTIAQLSDIFTGKTTNWKELGGKDAKIVILSREVNSGTHVYFKEHVLRKNNPNSQEEFAHSALLMPSSQAIADEVASNPQAIGYYGMGYLSPNQKAVAVAKDTSSSYILPTIENVVEGKYAISRPLFMYTNGQPTGLVKEFLDFVLSNEGQKIVLEIDFVPIKVVKD
jgi:phosphate transport system substrate-binding protein